MAELNWTTQLHSALDEYLRTRELEEGRELPPEAPTLEDRRAELNQQYWVTVRQLLGAASRDVPEASLGFTSEASELLNYGLFPHPALDSARIKLNKSVGVDGVMLFAESLNAVLDDVLRREVIGEFRGEIDALAGDISLWPDMHLAHVHYRDDKVRDLLKDTPRGSHVLRLLGEVDEKLESYKRLQARERNGGLSREDQKSWSTIKHFVESRLKQVQSIMTPSSDADDPSRMVDAGTAIASVEAVQESVAHLIELHEKKRGLEKQVLEQQSAARSVTQPEIEKALNRELSAVASLLRLAARYVQQTECAVPVDDTVEFVDADRAADAMDRMLRFDPRMIDNPMAARFGLPDLLLAPGIGDGVFDAARNRWVVPQRCTRSPEESMAHAAILYRLEVDSREMKKALLASYRESIPANRNVRANLKLRTNLIADYINWMTLETYGEEVLSRDAREWFERHIAPSKTEPWQPTEYLGLGEHDLKSILAELRESADSSDVQFRIAAIEWLLEPNSEEAVRERILPGYQRALALEDSHPGATYSVAVLQMMLGDFQKAITGFRRFTELVPRSWWSRKAIELCAKCR